MCKEKYVSPFTDFGFKRLFGSEHSKEFLVSFLNSLLDRKDPIADIRYETQERLGMSEGMRNAIFDIYCTTDRGDSVIVEMQNMLQKFFVDRSIFYSTFPIQDAAVKGQWDFKLPDVYTVSFLNFTLDQFRESKDWRHTIRLCDVKTGKTFSGKLTYIYLELPKYQKEIEELATPLDEWIYLIKNINDFETPPHKFADGIFNRFIRIAELSAMSKSERRAYEESLKELRDYTNTITTAEERGEAKGLAKGLAKGRAEGEKAGRLEIARKLLDSGMSAAQVAEITGIEHIERE